ncbi:MAG: Hpt domain-containing protein [Pseudomonadota bacterium]
MIDWDKIAELQSEIGEDDFVEVAQVFVEEIDEKLSAMAGTDSHGADDFHFLRGSAANLGLTDFADFCGAVETAGGGTSADLAEARRRFDAARAELNEIIAPA